MGAVRKFASLPNICEEEGRLGQHLLLYSAIQYTKAAKQNRLFARLGKKYSSQ
jgi:hypothetical protein